MKDRGIIMNSTCIYKNKKNSNSMNQKKKKKRKKRCDLNYFESRNLKGIKSNLKKNNFL